MPSPADDSNAPGRQIFASTRWSIVLTASTATPAAGAALGVLCSAYWYPLYTFVRRNGFSPHDAQDLTQEFFRRLIEKSWLGDVHPDRGRFRSFLLAAVKHFLANEWDRTRAEKRGGGQIPVSLDLAFAEAQYGREPADPATAEQVYDRRWACALLEKVLSQLRTEFTAIGKAEVFEQLEPALTGDKLAYAEIATRLHLTEGAVRVAVHRLRLRYRDLVRAEIAETVESEQDVDAELQHLFAALSH
jgi:RNA polymerase sigma-70 factor (ECF subfamily)